MFCFPFKNFSLIISIFIMFWVFGMFMCVGAKVRQGMGLLDELPCAQVHRLKHQTVNKEIQKTIQVKKEEDEELKVLLKKYLKLQLASAASPPLTSSKKEKKITKKIHVVTSTSSDESETDEDEEDKSQ